MGNAWGMRNDNAACHILPFCAKLKLLWQPESGPTPVAMVEKDGLTMFEAAECVFNLSVYYK